MLKPGDKAPDFTLRDHTGKTHSLSEYRGKTVVLWFYPKADTPGCTAEGCGFRDQRPQYQQKNAEILGVSFDGAGDNKAFAEKFGFNFPLLCDTERKVGFAYGACDDLQAPTARRVGVIIGPDGLVKAYYPKVDARAFPQQALGEL